MTFNQSEFDIRCEWAEQGLAELAPLSDAIIIVDVMSFSTCVSVAIARGATVYPCRTGYDAGIAFARSIGAEHAESRGTGRYSLSPASLLQIPAGTRLVLPSLNGSTLTLAAGRRPTFAGCLRNAKSVAEAAMRCGARVAVIPAGERWKDDGTLRPALEDLIGAGAIIRHLTGVLSPEARLAMEAFRSLENDLLSTLGQCASGQELIALGFERDIPIIAEIDVEDCAPLFRHGAYGRTEPAQ